MTKGDRRRNRRRYKVRYDRLAVLLLALLTVAVIATSCMKAMTGKDPLDDLPGTSPDIPVSEPETTAPPEDDSDTEATTAPEEDTTKSRDPWSEPATEPPSLSEPEPVTDSPYSADYKTISCDYDDIFTGDLVLVNAEHEYQFIEGDTDIVTLYDHKNDYFDVCDNVTKADSAVADQLCSMMEAFTKAAGREKSDIWIFDGYRTYNEQISRRSDGKSRFEAGYTDYHTGRTIDMLVMNEDATTYYFSPEGDYEWFKENAAKYGFIVRFPADKSDFTGERPRSYTYRYVGAPHAQYIAENGLCLEEYIDELRGHTIDDQLKIHTDSGDYRVYFLPEPESGDPAVLVPRTESYTVSGNNVDGFIVTVEE
ncbi:MAG: D-alanyl-D-alanine carboxypeptidase family protein [Ruminococcus sp.]|nr:D-alanyl-D-alanine carboxypeptidase family protein [Ruminococcus sp.]